MLNSVSTIERNPDQEEIEQVRKLLFGDIQSENERRIAALEAQLRELRQTFERRMSAMAEENSTSQAQLIRALGEAIAQLGGQISALAGDGPDNAASDE